MLLKNKKILITGLANKYSIAAGIASSMHREGAELAFTYQNERLLKNLKPLANEYGSDILIGTARSNMDIAALINATSCDVDGPHMPPVVGRCLPAITSFTKLHRSCAKRGLSVPRFPDASSPSEGSR